MRGCSTGNTAWRGAVLLGTLVDEGLFYWEHWLVRDCPTGNTGW